MFFSIPLKSNSRKIPISKKGKISPSFDRCCNWKDGEAWSAEERHCVCKCSIWDRNCFLLNMTSAGLWNGQKPSQFLCAAVFVTYIRLDIFFNQTRESQIEFDQRAFLVFLCFDFAKPVGMLESWLFGLRAPGSEHFPTTVLLWALCLWTQSWVKLEFRCWWNALPWVRKELRNQ